MSNDYEDMSGIYEDEESPVSRDDILSVLEEQRRLEQEALAAALPLQRAEASALEADWRQGAGAGVRARPTEPVEYAQGTVMPTSSGFMYMGNPLEAPPAGGPLATQRAFESAVLLQNRPKAFAAQRELGDMGAPLPTGYAGVPFQAPMPMDTKEQMQAEVMRRNMAGLGAGMTPSQAVATSGADAYERLFRPGRQGITDYQRILSDQRDREFKAKQEREARLAEVAKAKLTPEQQSSVRIGERAIAGLRQEMLLASTEKRKRELEDMIAEEEQKLAALFKRGKSEPIYMDSGSPSTASAVPGLTIGGLRIGGSPSSKYTVKRVR